MAELIEFRAEVKAWAKQLSRVEGDLALAAAEMLNTVGGFAHAQSLKNIRKDFTIRNRYTEGSMRAYPVNYRKSNGAFREVSKMRYITGTVSAYLPLQETGGTQRAKKKAIAMPTLQGRGGSASRAIPRSLQLRTLGDRAFVLKPSASGAPRMRKGKPVPYTLDKAAIFVRKGRKLVKLRLVDEKTQKVKATRWHLSAMQKWGTWPQMQKAYTQAAKRIIAGDRVAF